MVALNQPSSLQASMYHSNDLQNTTFDLNKQFAWTENSVDTEELLRVFPVTVLSFSCKCLSS